jgi:hypothetical protein
VLAVAISLVVLVVAANLVVLVYARGVVRAAVDEGARSGSRAGGSVDSCELRAASVLGDLLGGAMRRSVAVVCRAEPGAMTARADARFAGWVGALVPTWSFTIEARVVEERVP